MLKFDICKKSQCTRRIQRLKFIAVLIFVWFFMSQSANIRFYFDNLICFALKFEHSVVFLPRAAERKATVGAG